MYGLQPPPAPAPAAPEPAPATITEPDPAPALVTGPAAILSPDPAMAPLDMTVPALPQAVPAPAPATTTVPAGAPGYNPLDPVHDLNATKRKRREPGVARRTVSRLMLVGVLGAGGFAAYEYGPGLYDEYVAKDTVASEPDAPLAFPVPLTAVPEMAAATVLLEDIADAPGTAYLITTDFNNDVARVEVQREDFPNLEVLTYGEAAFVRRIDGSQWYALERGGFPLDDQLDRATWVRTLDEFLPAAARETVSIDRSTDSTVGTTPTRHLFLTVDSTLLTEVPVPVLPVGEDLQVDASAEADAALDPIEITTTVPTPVTTVGATTQVELWIDDSGLIRQIAGAPQLGAGTITVISTSPAPYIPDFPDPIDVAPLTAAALIELAI